MKNYYIIHGFMGSNIENWFPWFKEQIDSDNTLCVIPQFPIEVDKHNYNEWKKLLDVTGITIYGENVLVKNVKLKKIKNI